MLGPPDATDSPIPCAAPLLLHPCCTAAAPSLHARSTPAVLCCAVLSAVASLSGAKQLEALLQWPDIRDTFLIKQGTQVGGCGVAKVRVPVWVCLLQWPDIWAPFLSLRAQKC